MCDFPVLEVTGNYICIICLAILKRHVISKKKIIKNIARNQGRIKSTYGSQTPVFLFKVATGQCAPRGQASLEMKKIRNHLDRKKFM